MKPAQLKNNNNEKHTYAKRLKPVSTYRKQPLPYETKYATSTEVGRPESCPTSNSSWVPSRDWHQYLTSTKLQPRGDRTSRPSDAVALTKPKDELLVRLPKVNFCSMEGEEFPSKPSLGIADLCDEDKKKIAHLVEELVRCKQEKDEDQEKILSLKNRVSELKASLKSVTAESRTAPESQGEREALKQQLSELNQLLYHMQVQKSTSEVQIKTITAQAEKMTRAIHAMHKENTELQVELRVTKERLGVAQQALDKMTKDIKDVSDHIRPAMEDKACQSSEALCSEEKVHVKRIKLPEVVSDDQQILTELFFNKSLQNDFLPKETIIFLPESSSNFAQQFE